MPALPSIQQQTAPISNKHRVPPRQPSIETWFVKARSGRSGNTYPILFEAAHWQDLQVHPKSAEAGTHPRNDPVAS